MPSRTVVRRPPAPVVEIILCEDANLTAMSTGQLTTAVTSDPFDFGAYVLRIQALSQLKQKLGSFSYSIDLEYSWDGIEWSAYGTALLSNSTTGNANGQAVDLTSGTTSQNRGRYLRFVVKTLGTASGDAGVLSASVVLRLME